MNSDIFFYSLIGGIIPALIWLTFWLREDSKRPEPRGLLMATFAGGMFAVVMVIPFQNFFYRPDIFSPMIMWALMATFEELFKFGAAFFIVLRRKETDEPIDAVIYMMTAALGFVALENSLFILDSFSRGDIFGGIMTGNFRFIGASLLHTISSAAIGVAIALSFYKNRVVKIISAFIGIIVAIALHTLFNFFIMKETDSVTLATFGFVWIAIVILMLFFERIKKIYAVNKI